jgi:diguanylate cyclase (GGDEF)-like protein
LKELVEAGAGASRSAGQRQVAVLFIDLDEFKPVNDRYGHAAGDAVLVAVAARLRESTRGSDLIARLGGDEFAVLLDVRDREEVTSVSDRILESLERPIVHDDVELRVGASIGIADTHLGGDRPSRTAAELLRIADIAMYAAKAKGGNQAAA